MKEKYGPLEYGLNIHVWPVLIKDDDITLFSIRVMNLVIFFFFQAEDGIRDRDG